jgi:acyl-CoA thioesterase FadM
MPEKVIFRVEIPVRITDMNYGNHLGNDALVGLIHEARVAWLRTLEYSELDTEGSGLIMSELVVSYVNESFYGDVLTISLSPGELSRAGFEIYYLVEAARNQTSIVIAKVRTGMVYYDYAARKVVALPQKVKNHLSS